MEHDNFLGGAFNKKMGELNIDKLSEISHIAYLCILESYPRVEERVIKLR